MLSGNVSSFSQPAMAQISVYIRFFFVIFVRVPKLFSYLNMLRFLVGWMGVCMCVCMMYVCAVRIRANVIIYNKMVSNENDHISICIS